MNDLYPDLACLFRRETRGNTIDACKDDLRVATSRYAVDYFNCCYQAFSDLMAPVIIDMVNSDNDEVAEEGAKEVYARWLFHRHFDKEYRQCKSGTVPQRRGLASVASTLIKEEKYTKDCLDQLLTIFNDPDKGVRDKTGRAFFNNPEILMFKVLVKQFCFLLKVRHLAASFLHLTVIIRGILCSWTLSCGTITPTARQMADNCARAIWTAFSLWFSRLRRAHMINRMK